ncbi:LacI family DNA-binding transcriptional regulator [Actinoplanes sp. NPDC089786]|uniref:LacI family DNA-binding transcriptional regulator n=1 Tax=Actinoplanes sp. NPDC089786 TaxID=3155185 RepID=UPI003416684D
MREAAGRRQAVRISDVARAAGVSKTLVSYALNDRAGVKESTRAHIVATARSMGWTPSFRARALSASRAYTVGLVLRIPAEGHYFTGLLAGLQSVLSTSQYSLLTEVVDGDEAEEDAYRRLALGGRVDGLVLTDPRHDDPRFRLVREAGLAFVSLGRPPEPTTMPVLIHDESRAIADAVAHLAALGHRRIAQVAGPQTVAAAGRRRRLYQKVLREHDLDDTSWLEADHTAAGGRAATVKLLDEEPRPTAIVYANDLMAVAGMSAIHERGLRVPADVSVIGWDDLAVAPYLNPPLSTVGRHPFEDGRAAARLLLEAIDGQEFAEPVPAADPTFVARDSAARPA